MSPVTGTSIPGTSTPGLSPKPTVPSQGPAVALTPPIFIADSLGTQFQFVAQKNGNDYNNGLSWGAPKASIEAAVAATPNGGLIFIAPGVYSPAETIVVNGHHFIGQIGAGGSNADVTIKHAFNGNLFSFLAGGSFTRIYLESPLGTYTGTGIYGLSPANGEGKPRIGTIYLNQVTCSGFQHNLLLDGTADGTVGGPGIRQVFATDCLFFGTSEEQNVWLRRVIHAYFKGCEIIQAPAATKQKFQIDHHDSQEIQWHGGYILGDFSSEANSDVIISGRVSGNVTFSGSTETHRIMGSVGGSVTNNGLDTNIVDGHLLWKALPAGENKWVTSAAAYALDSNGEVHFRGSLTGPEATLAAGTTLFTMPEGLRSPRTWEQGVWMNEGGGTGKIGQLSVVAGGAVKIETGLGAGTSAVVRLDGVKYSLT